MKRSWWILIGATQLGLAAALAHGLVVDRSPLARAFLPGPTSHGHYQIELQCSACHTAGQGVRQEACLECHAAELKAANDTHPLSKFTDPGKAHLLERLDARHCTTCHQEHVPERTHPMGLSMPTDYCIRCHEDVGEQRPSHRGLEFQSCAAAGCHNYHDNTALNENFLAKNADTPELRDAALVSLLVSAVNGAPHEDDGEAVNPRALTADQQDAPRQIVFSSGLVRDWAETGHAAAGVNCSHCHARTREGREAPWSDAVGYETCQRCHAGQTEGFLAGRHGMRLAAGLPAMTPGDARLPMQADAAHRELNCNACHPAHRFDVRQASVDACLQCHNDAHSRAYLDSKHYALWQAEVAGQGTRGSGVSCATCHLPRTTDSAGHVHVQHNQNDNLRPNEKMVRTSCLTCHGLQFALDSLADPALIARNFQGTAAAQVESLRMAVAWFAARAKRKRPPSSSPDSPPSQGPASQRSDPP